MVYEKMAKNLIHITCNKIFKKKLFDKLCLKNCYLPGYIIAFLIACGSFLDHF